MKPEEAKNLIENSGAFHETYLGYRTSSLGIEENVGIDDDKRMMHVLNIGPTGFGKSQLMVHAAIEDAHKDHGLCIINPKGAMIDEFLNKLPDEREDDVIYLNPNKERGPSINVLEPHITAGMTPAERNNQKEIIVSDLVDVFRRLSENWGDRWGRNLKTLLRAHIHLNVTRNEQNTLMDVLLCITEDEKMLELINRVHKPVIRKQLEQMHNLTQKEMEPLQRRVNDFIQNETVRRIITQPDNSINFRDALNNGKIILVDVQKGEIGKAAASLIGSIVITKVWAAAQSRISIPEEERRPFYLYVDELQSFASEGSNFAKILSEAREYKLGCWLASQYLHQLSSDMQRAVANNCRTKIFFNPAGSEDLNQLVGMLQGVEKHQLTALGTYRAAFQAPASQEYEDAVIFDTYPPWEVENGRCEELKQELLASYDAMEDLTDEVAVTGRAETPSDGKEDHAELLKAARDYLSEQGCQVNILYQENGESKPDGTVIREDGSIANLEAECSTLTRPVKVLRNVERAVEEDREVVFVVEKGSAVKLENVLDDPVNRRGTEHEDEDGGFSYYADEEGGEFTEIEMVDEVEYRILEAGDNGVIPVEGTTEAECPELEHSSEQQLQGFCWYRDDDTGFCEALEQPCVLAGD